MPTSRLDEAELALAIFESRSMVKSIFAEEMVAKRRAGLLEYSEEVDRRLAARYANVILATLRRNRQAET